MSVDVLGYVCGCVHLNVAVETNVLCPPGAGSCGLEGMGSSVIVA